MPHLSSIPLSLAAGALLAMGGIAAAQSTDPRPPVTPDSQLLRTNVPNLVPGAPPPAKPMANPAENDPGSLQRGMTYFLQFNCVGCHADNGAGGMGPALSNATWLHGSTPANIYLTIAQGRGNGMPAFGRLLPDQVIWDLVTYVRSISQDPEQKSFGTTISLEAFAKGGQQVPAEKVQSTNPWNMTEPFKFGQKP
jgi:cytochrome c oxidase cbb3-type subunit 3